MGPPFDFCFLRPEGQFWTPSGNSGPAEEEAAAWGSREAAFSEGETACQDWSGGRGGAGFEAWDGVLCVHQMGIVTPLKLVTPQQLQHRLGACHRRSLSGPTRRC